LTQSLVTKNVIILLQAWMKM